MNKLFYTTNSLSLCSFCSLFYLLLLLSWHKVHKINKSKLCLNCTQGFCVVPIGFQVANVAARTRPKSLAFYQLQLETKFKCFTRFLLTRPCTPLPLSLSLFLLLVSVLCGAPNNGVAQKTRALCTKYSHTKFRLKLALATLAHGAEQRSTGVEE